MKAETLNIGIVALVLIGILAIGVVGTLQMTLKDIVLW